MRSNLFLVMRFRNDENVQGYGPNGWVPPRNNPLQVYPSSEDQSYNNSSWPLSPGNTSINSGMSSVISASEAQFLMRQAGGSQGHGQGYNEQITNRFGNNNGNKKNEDINIFHNMLGPSEREIELEKLVASLEKKIKQKDDIIQDLDDKWHKKIREVEALRLSSAEEIRKLSQDADRELTLLKEAHARQLASISTMKPVAQTNSNTYSSGNSISNASGNYSVGDGDEDSTSGGSKHLLNQLDRLRVELKHQQDIFAQERKQLQSDSLMKLEARDRQSRAEILSLREMIREKDDKISTLTDELTAAVAKSDGLILMCKQLEQSRVEAVEASNKLRADLKGMQQAVSASYRLESSQSLGIGVDADTAIRLNEAKLSAKERQINNKLEFLKGQLSAEQAVSEDLRVTLQKTNARLEEFKEEYRIRMKEAEVARQVAVEEAERRLELQYEGRMNELASLQAKVAMLQGQLQDVFQDSQVAKQREDALKVAAAKTASQMIALRTEADTLRKQVQ